MNDKLHLFVCKNLYSEVDAAIQAENLTDVVLDLFPTDLCVTKKNWDSIRPLASKLSPGSQVVVLGGGCLGSLGEPPADLSFCKLYQLEQCFHFFVSKPMLEQCLRKGAYVVTPGWLAHWREHVEGQWQMNRHIAQEFFRESTSHLLLLDTLTDPNSALDFDALAQYLELPCETMPVGLDYFRLFLGKIVLEWRWQTERQAAYETLTHTSRQSADYAMTFDLIGSLTGILAEENVIDRVLMLLTMLVAPNQILFASLVDGKPERIWPCLPENQDTPEKLLERFAFAKDYAWNEDQSGFRLKIIHSGDTLGLIEINGFAFPQYKEHYLNIALVIAQVSGLAIKNARSYHTLGKTIEELETEITARKQVEKRLRYLSTHDIMSELYNRTFFDEELARLEHSRLFPVSIIIADVDRLKQVNDTLGHIAGDRQLQRAAQVFRQCFRAEDIVARIGGDEFAALMPNTSYETAFSAMVRIRKTLEKYNPAIDVFPLAISLGLATAVKGDDLMQAVKRADAQMYQDKRQSQAQT